MAEPALTDGLTRKKGTPTMKLKQELPPDRTYEQIKNHFEVERALAEKLKRANRQERKVIYQTMYDELFEKVPDHSRLTRRNSEQMTLEANRNKLSLIRDFIDEETVFVEIAPGDCRFCREMARHVRRVYGIDISDQSGDVDLPENFELIVYDGYDLEFERDSVDVAFSDQLIEHFHPEDTELHFRLVHRILKKNGIYVFRTPHGFSGPHDISKYFTDEPQGFHLKEWTFLELAGLMRRVGYSSWKGYWQAKGRSFRFPFLYFWIVESALRGFPKGLKRKLSRYLLPQIFMVAVK